MYICVRLCRVSFDTCHFRGLPCSSWFKPSTVWVGTVLALWRSSVWWRRAGGSPTKITTRQKFSLEADLAAKQEEVDRLAGQLTASRQQVNRLADDVRAKAAEIVSLNKDLEEKRKEIQRLATAAS